MDPIRVTNDSRFRILEEADTEEHYGLVEQNRDYLAEWMPWAAGLTLEGSREFIKKTRRQIDENDGFQGALFLDGRMVGLCGFISVNWESRSTELGYWLAEEHQGRGLMTRTVKALVEHAFGEWELNRVEIQAATGNRKSRALAERLGFQQEGVLREYERVGDRYVDIVVYSLLAADRETAG